MGTRARKSLPETARIRLERFAPRGGCVGRHAEKPVLVHGGLPGEEVEVRFFRLGRRRAEGVVSRVITPASQRVTPRCPHFGDCGGCSLQHMERTAQIAYKQEELVSRLVAATGQAPDEVRAPAIGEGWGYRRKARLSVKWLRGNEEMLVGFRRLGGSHVAILSSCDVLHPAVGTRLEALREVIASLRGREGIPQVEVAVGDEGAALVMRHLQTLEESDRLKLVEFANRYAFDVYLQSGGPETIVPLYPASPRSLYYRLPQFGLRFEFGPLDFIQVNVEANQMMVATAVRLMAPRPNERIVDLFCGLGNFTLPLALSGARVTGFEGDPGLVRKARHNSAINGVTGVSFRAIDLYRDELDDPFEEEIDKVLLDPPRSGARGVLRHVMARNPRRIVYVSCNPDALVEETALLVRHGGYRLRSTGVIDMFPHTNHVESVTLLERG